MDHNTQSVVWALLVAVFTSSVLLLQLHQSRRRTTHFPFAKLPAELRNLVYEQVIDSGPKPCFPAAGRTLDSSVTGLRWLGLRGHRRSPKSHAIMLVSKQLHSEFMDVMCKRTALTLRVDESNYSASPLWPLRQSTIDNVRRTSLEITATSRMLGAGDPRYMPNDWPLQKRIFGMLESMPLLQEQSLFIRAIGDPLWNPLWVWYHISQAFKDLKGLQTIKFGLDSRSPGENYLFRLTDGTWEWRCAEGHFVAEDGGRQPQPIRVFCGFLYNDCETCNSNNIDGSALAGDF